MFLSKTSSGIYYVFFTDDRGKRQKISTRSTQKSAAFNFLRSFDLKSHQNKSAQQQLQFQKFVNEFLTYAEGILAKGTVDMYRYSFDHFRSIIGEISLNLITPRHFDLYKVHRLKTVSPVTTNIELRCLKAALNTAVRWELIEKNPFNGQKLASVTESVPIFFTKDDFHILIQSIKENWLREIVIFATLTGMRRNEILNLRWNNISLERKTINIQSSPTFKTKNGKRRTIPLNDIALYILQEKFVGQNSEYVFLLNCNRIMPSWLSHKFKYYVYACRFKDDKLHFHSLRHTFASWLAQEGVSIYAIKEFLGHSDIKTTQIYAHLRVDHMHDTVNKLHIDL